MVDAVRFAEKSLGHANFGASEKEEGSRLFRRSLFVVADMKCGGTFTEQNVPQSVPGTVCILEIERSTRKVSSEGNSTWHSTELGFGSWA